MSSRKEPFFIMGAVRSGTTILRDVIASHPRLFCPNETHFFRFADPFGTIPFVKPLLNQPLFKKHRKLDGVTEEQFQHEILQSSSTRREMLDKYAEAYLAAQGAPPDARWFDKTPQHVYGLLLISEEYPQSPFIHIVRHPLNVISSLRLSGVMNIQSVKAAANYWYESTLIMRSAKNLLPRRVLEVLYGDFCHQPKQEVEKICAFIDEDAAALRFNFGKIVEETPKYKQVLSTEDMNVAWSICGNLAEDYGFHL